MKTTLTKLTEKLCEVEEIREDIMELRFGCEFRLKHNKGQFNVLFKVLDNNPYDTIVWNYHSNEGDYFLTNDIKNSYPKDENATIKIIGNRPQLHHLLWYCGSNSKRIVVRGDGVISDVDNWIDICKYDITKDLSNQSEEVLEAILNFITG